MGSRESGTGEKTDQDHDSGVIVTRTTSKEKGSQDAFIEKSPDNFSSTPKIVDSDIYRLTWVLLRGWWIILIVVILSVLYSGYSLTKYGPNYTAHMTIREVDKAGSGIQLPSKYDGLAQTFGVAKDKSSTPFDDFVVLLGTPMFAELLDDKYGYVNEVFKGQWNAQIGEWIPPVGWKVDLDKFFRQFAPIGEWTPPNTEQLAGYIAGSINIVEIEGIKDLHRIEFHHPERQFALSFLHNVFHEAEQYMRSNQTERITRMVEFVKRKLAKVTIRDYREALLHVLAEQEKKLIELQSGSPYVAGIIQPPVVSEAPSSPNVFVRLVLGVLVGLMLGAIVVLIVAFFKTGVSQRRFRARE